MHCLAAGAVEHYDDWLRIHILVCAAGLGLSVAPGCTMNGLIGGPNAFDGSCVHARREARPAPEQLSVQDHHEAVEAAHTTSHVASHVGHAIKTAGAKTGSERPG